MTRTILRLDASARTEGSVSRSLTDDALALHPEATVIIRDLNEMPHINETWVGATFTPESARTTEQSQALELSDRLLQDVQTADHIVISTAMYNFAIPSTLKAWLDHIARAGISFEYTKNGPKGLLNDTCVTVIIASGGVTLGTPADFMSDYIRFMFGFVGITDVTIIGAQAHTLEDAKAQITERML
jgi:FMN-dependent NADH-azoreductase